MNHTTERLTGDLRGPVRVVPPGRRGQKSWNSFFRAGKKEFLGHGGKAAKQWVIKNRLLEPRFSPEVESVCGCSLIFAVSNHEDTSIQGDINHEIISRSFLRTFSRTFCWFGPHRIEIEAPGLESQVFDVYVDPDRTIDLHADLLR